MAMDGMDPEKMTSEERLEELAMLLATGLLRSGPKRQEKGRIPPENRLELPAETSPPAIDL